MNKDYYLFMWLTMGIIIYIFGLWEKEIKVFRREIFRHFLAFPKVLQVGTKALR